ncbi:hypothetical protein CASFOL_005482 [Castilleja foliolosa]|uniref:BED-type domain-containing protein n=1 Tax=Castilleja foliolosa TaxID=1961234 RepID=A0ABD3E4N1_9LAMI
METPNIVDLEMNDDDDDDSVTGAVHVPNDGASGLNPKPKKRKKENSSVIWAYFTSIGLDKDGRPKVECNSCTKELCAGGTLYGTSTITRHLKSCPKFNGQQDVGDMLLDNTAKLRSRKINQVTFREKMATAIIKHDLPFSFVEYEGIRDLLTYCNPDVKVYSRNTAASDVCES